MIKHHRWGFFWTKATLLILAMIVIRLLPDFKLGSFGPVSLKSILSIVLAISFIQVVGDGVAQTLGARRGGIITGFLSGLMSSTATAVSVSSSSKLDHSNSKPYILVYISATIAMQIICVAILFFGAKEIYYSLLLILAPPTISALIMLYAYSKSPIDKNVVVASKKFKFSKVLKLSLFILLTMLITKFVQLRFSSLGVGILTFIVSLFEIHGSIFSNIQLYDAGSITYKNLGLFILISLVASYTSKIFFVTILGSHFLFRQALRYTFVSLLSLGIGWLLFGRYGEP